MTIDDCIAGIGLFDTTIDLENVYFDGIEYPLGVFGSSAYPDIRHITADECEEVGVCMADYADAVFTYNIIDCYDSNGICIWLGTGTDIHPSYSDLIPGDFSIYLESDAEDVYAGGNYWGDPYPAWNYINYPPNKVTIGFYSQYHVGGSGVYKPPLIPEANDIPAVIAQLDDALAYERSDNWDDARTLYLDVLASSDNSSYRRQALKSLLRVTDRTSKNYSELRQLIEKEARICPDHQQALYDNLLCELFVREGRYQDAVDAYEQLLPKYREIETEVGVLTRLVRLYGGKFDNKEKAREYADRAAGINPGELSLAVAYRAADIKYNPYEFDDVFSTRRAKPRQQEEQLTEEITEFIGNSPNPFNPATTFTYAIADPGHVELSVYSITGQKVATLVDDVQTAGTHSVQFNGSSLGSGMYFYRFQSPGFTTNGKMLLVK